MKLNIPTVPFPHVFLPTGFNFYLKEKTLPKKAEEELRNLFGELQKTGYNLTVRPSIFADIPGAEFIVPNTVNIPDFQKVLNVITQGFDKIIKDYGKAEKIEFAYLIQGFYTASKAGLVYSDDGQGFVHIEGAFGEHSQVLTRGKVKPDIYKIDKKTGEITTKIIAEKDFTLVASEDGLEEKKLVGSERTRPVFTAEELKKIYEYARAMEKKFGPQEVECAVLTSDGVIFQSSRDSKLPPQAKTDTTNIPIFLRAVKGKAIFLRDLLGQKDLREKIVVTDNLDIDFITHLIYRFKPKGVILTKGSLTAHAVTILREAKVASILATDLKFGKQKLVEIKTTGEIALH